MSKLNPEQEAFDRIQQAAATSPLTIGDTVYSHELHANGIRIVGRSTSGLTVDHTVSWIEIMQARVNPLPRALGILCSEMEHVERNAL